MKILNAKTLVVLAALASTQALAGHGGGPRDGRAIYDKAKVVSVQPITEFVRVASPRRECWTEDAVYYERRDDSAAYTLVGGLIGGVVGHQIGRGRDKQVATAAGTVIGAVVGNDLGRKSGYTQSYPVSEQRCQVVDEYYEEEHVVGYRVRYRYRGDEYTARMDHDPGRFVRVRVAVSVVD